jgi:glycosyltransferase involved in cell wall biosynthesis
MTDLVEGLIDFPSRHEITLFCKNETTLPREIKGRCKAVVVSTPSWTDTPRPLWQRIPKLRSSMAMHRNQIRKTNDAQRNAIENALNQHPVDILHIPSALDIGSYPIYDYPCPVIMTFLDAIVLRLKDDVYSRYPAYLKEVYHSQAENLKRADHIVAISQASADDAIELFGVDPNRISVIYPIVSNTFSEVKPLGRWEESRPYYLFCSVPDPHKNPRVVMEAFAKIGGDSRLIFVAPNDTQYAPNLLQFAQELEIEERFTITGFVEQDELIALFQNAVAVVSPSKMEGFGLPVAQAMKCGTPVVTNRLSAQGEIALGIGFLVNPNSVSDVADAMRQAALEPRSSERLLKGKERAEQFSTQQTTQKLIDLYEKTIDEKRKSSRY